MPPAESIVKFPEAVSISLSPDTPIWTLSILAPPFASKAPVNVVAPLAFSAVKAPVEAEFAPMAVPSTAPPFISTVDNVDVPLVTFRSAPTVKSLSNSVMPLIVTLSSDLPSTIWLFLSVVAPYPIAVEYWYPASLEAPIAVE